MGKITYKRGTTYNYTNTYQHGGVNSTLGSKLYFTVKTVQTDSVVDDSSALFQIPVTMSGAINTVKILPTTVSDTVLPGTYYYDVKVIEVDPTNQYVVDSGQFVLQGATTNKVS